MGRVIVVGAGAAGLLAAFFAARQGASVTVIEKNARPGEKLALTGNGRGNITHWAEMDDLIREIPGNGRFLYSAFRQFGPEALRRILEDYGVPTKVEADGRVFPCSDRAADVIKAFVDGATGYGVEWIWGASVKHLRISEHRIEGVLLESGAQIDGNAVILCTGGASYPKTGSTGDGYILAEEAGHEIVPVKPSLVPLIATEPWLFKLQGVSLKDTGLKAFDASEKIVGEARGDLIFTHFGLSGPAVLRLSRSVVLALRNNRGPVSISINLCSELHEDALDREIQERIGRSPRKTLKNVLTGLLPEKIITILFTLASVDEEKPAHQLSRSERLLLGNLIRDLRIRVEGPQPLAAATVTMGGVSIKDVDPKTMASRKVSGLFFAGELLDVDGFTGGYNLQAAFSTGAVAGMAAADYVC